LRELGALFEKSTTESFSEAMLKKQQCPELDFFKQQVSLGQIRLESAYAK